MSDSQREVAQLLVQSSGDNGAQRHQNWLKWLFTPGSGLSQRALQAGFWAFALRITLRVFTTLRTIILARLLAPNDFGLMGIALLMMSLLETFTQTGFRSALVQRQGDIHPYLNTAWAIQVLRGVVTGGGLVLAAPLVADFFDAPAAKPIVQVMAISILLNGFTNIGIVYFQKELEFRKRFLYQLARTVPQVGVGIGLAFALQNVWALVYGALAGSAAQVLTSYLLHPYRPRFTLEWAKALELYHFGKWVFGSNMLYYLLRHIDDLVVGKVLGPAALGLYRMAYNLSQMVSTEIVEVSNQVTFPAYSKLQDRQDRLGRAYIETVGLTSLIIFPLCVGGLVLAQDLVGLLLGDAWMPMVPAFQVLLLLGLVQSVGANNGPLFFSVGKPGRAAWLQLGRVGIIGLAIYPMISYLGIMGAALTVCVGALIIHPLQVLMVRKIIQCPIMSYLKALAAPLVCSLVMAGIVLLTRSTVLGQPSWWGVVILVLIGAFTYGALVLFSVKFFHYQIGATLRRALANRASVA